MNSDDFLRLERAAKRLAAFAVMARAAHDCRDEIRDEDFFDQIRRNLHNAGVDACYGDECPLNGARSLLAELKPKPEVQHD